MIEKKDIEKIAALARIEFTESEKDLIPDQLVEIIAYIDKLNELDTGDTEPLGQPVVDEMPFRDDEESDCPCISEITANAPDFSSGYFIVKKIIE